MIFKIINETILKREKITAEQFLILEAILYKEYFILDEYLNKVKNRNELLQNLHRRDFIELEEEELGYEFAHNLYLGPRGVEALEKIEDVYKAFRETNDTIPASTFETDFNEFWDTYPPNDKYLSFPATRALKTAKDKCKKLYRTLCNEYTHERILNALKKEIELRQHNSLSRKGKSDFCYMQSSLTWLNQKTFLSYEGIEGNENIADYSQSV